MELLKKQRIWSKYTTFLVMLGIGLFFSPYTSIFNEFGVFVTGGVAEISRSDQGFLSSLPALLLIASVTFIISMTIFLLFKYILRVNVGGHALDDIFALHQDADYHFQNFVILIALEEVVARWLFLGVLPEMFPASGTVGFYTFLIIGNSLWSLIHLLNFKDRKDKRKIYMVLPQFIVGVFFSYIFVKHGLVASIVAHLAYNTILFAATKVNVYRLKEAIIDFIIIGVTIFLASILSAKSVFDIVPWFNGVYDSASLADWKVVDYICVFLSMGSILSLIFNLLMYDAGTDDTKLDNVKMFEAIIIGVPSIVVIIIASNGILALFIDGLLMRGIVITLLLSLLGKSPSVSGAMKRFWTGLATTFILIVGIVSVGFWSGLLIAGVVMIYNQCASMLSKEFSS